MIIILFYSFIAGVITILSPCILPILPIILSSSTSTSSNTTRRPYGIIFGFIASFTFFTLFLSSIIQVTGLSSNFLRSFSILVVFFLGLSLLSSQIQQSIEKLFGSLASKIPSFDNGGTGFWSGFLVGLSLGLLWTPCVGPILASVITLAITGQVTFNAFLITLFYAFGTAIPMLIILQSGRTLFTKIPKLLSNTVQIQKTFGLFTVFIAIALFKNWDRSFQVYILNKFPNYGTNLTKIEENADLTKIGSKPKNISAELAPQPKVLPVLQKSPEVIAGGEWLNSPPLKISSLKGKVVLVDFWTYTCINCIRTLPYLKDWYQKYHPLGLEIIGVHSPEFEFEKDLSNLTKAVKDFGLTYPIVQDNNFSTWRAFSNNYWPAKYLVDAQGDVRYTHFGEGDYGVTEKAIQNLLKENNPSLFLNFQEPTVNKTYAKTPETYLGMGRGDYTIKELFQKNKLLHFDTPKPVSLHQVAFGGDYIISEQFANPQAQANLQLKFEAKDVYLVMSATESSKVKVFVDDKIQFFGKDNFNGTVEVKENRLYHLISLPEAGKHLLKLEFEDSKVKLFAFTFG